MNVKRNHLEPFAQFRAHAQHGGKAIKYDACLVPALKHTLDKSPAAIQGGPAQMGIIQNVDVGAAAEVFLDNGIRKIKCLADPLKGCPPAVMGKQDASADDFRSDRKSLFETNTHPFRPPLDGPPRNGADSVRFASR